MRLALWDCSFIREGTQPSGAGRREDERKQQQHKVPSEWPKITDFCPLGHSNHLFNKLILVSQWSKVKHPGRLWVGCHPLNKIINQLLCIIVCQSPVPPMSHFTVISLSHEIFFKERHCENQPLTVSLLRKSLTLFFHTASFLQSI